MYEQITVEQIKMAQIEFNCAANHLAAYCGLSGPRFSRGLTGDTAFTPAENEKIFSTITAMRNIQGSVTPKVPIAWDQIAQLRPLIDVQIKTGQDLIRTVYIVEFQDDKSLFEQFDENGICRRTLNPTSAAALKDRDLAVAVVGVLDRSGYRVLAHPTRTRIHESKIAASLKDVGVS